MDKITRTGWPLSEDKIMARGEALQWGIQIDTDGTTWNVTLVGGRLPDWRFSTFEAMIEWLEDENEGLKITRLVGSLFGE
jgi:hypothetical protein